MVLGKNTSEMARAIADSYAEGPQENPGLGHSPTQEPEGIDPMEMGEQSAAEEMMTAMKNGDHQLFRASLDSYLELKGLELRRKE